jgi:hypothetical protein
LCKCGLDTSFRAKLKEITLAMQVGANDLVSSGRYDTTDTFTVVAQPFMTQMGPPKTVISRENFFITDLIDLSFFDFDSQKVKLTFRTLLRTASTSVPRATLPLPSSSGSPW